MHLFVYLFIYLYPNLLSKKQLKSLFYCRMVQPEPRSSSATFLMELINKFIYLFIYLSTVALIISTLFWILSRTL